MVQMIFVPMTRDEVAALRSGPVRSGVVANSYSGCAATAGLIASLEADVIEEVEFAALNNAGVLALVLKPSPRLVVAAEVREDQVTDLGGSWGEVEVDGLAWAQVRALFADEPAAWDAAKLASKAVAGRSLGAAVAAPEVAAVLDEYDLLWYAPEELDQV